jgi:ligand-binding sensor domain-containing protein
MTFVKNNSFNYLLFLFFTILHSFLFAQEPVTYNLNDENGLPSNEVYEVLQDDFGFMWIGCDAGLYRYDGFEYKQYKNSAQNGRAISSLKMDNLGRIWSRNFKGQIYCVKGDSLCIITSQLKTNIAHAVYDLDAKNNSWSLRSGILYCISSVGKVLSSLPINFRNKSIGEINSISVVDEIIYLSDRGHSVYAFNTKTQTIIELQKEHAHAEKNYFFKKGKTLYFSSENSESNLVSIYKIQGITCTLVKSFSLSRSNPRLYSLATDKNEEIWMGTANGIAKLSTHFNNFDQLQTVVRGKNTSFIFQDREENYWITTLQDGIFIIPNMQIIKYEIKNSKLPENNLTALNAQKMNELLIGSFSGKLFHLDLITHDFFEIKPPKELKTVSVKFISFFNNAFYLSHGPLSVIENLKFKNTYPLYNLKDLEIQKGSLHYLVSDLMGSIPLLELNHNINFKFLNKGGREMIYSPSNDTYYYALNDGLFSLKNNRWVEIKYNGQTIHATGFALYSNSICISSISQGLLFMSGNKIIRAINESNSTCENELKCITISEKYIWVCGVKNLIRINIKTSQLGIFSIFNGINTKDINAITTSFGKIFLATNKGLITFPENILWKNSHLPTVRINYLILDGKVLKSNKNYVLPYNNNKFTINISSISFKSKGQYTYQYRIQNSDKTWTSLPANVKNIQLTRIPPGKYFFQIQAINENGILSTMKTFHFSVASPIWQKWWFYLLISLFFVLLFGIVFYFRIRYIKRRSDLKNKLTASQLTALKSQMNPHFMFNALNSIQDLVLRNDSKNSNIYLSKFSNLMRKILDASDKEYISLQNELDILNLYLDLEKLRFGNDFSFIITVDNTIDPYYIQLPSMIIQPFIENALKHGLLHKKGNKKLEIIFTLNDVLICEIIDNGIGRKHANEIKLRQANTTTSFATEATEKRIDLLNSYSNVNYAFTIIDLMQEDKPAGTKVILTLPLI